MSHKEKPQTILVGISIGDPNGIGPEIVLKTFSDPLMYDMYTPVVFASTKLISFYIKHFNLDLQVHGIKEPSEALPGKLNVLQISEDRIDVEWGQVSKVAGHYSILSFTKAVTSLKNDEIQVLVTAPIHKEAIQSEKFSFPGHTELLNQELEGEALMFMISDALKVGLLTDHIPISEVAQRLNATLVKQKIGTIKKTLKKDFGIVNPKIAVLGINPHVGDNGVIGTDDQDKLIPALMELRTDGTLIYGPYAADGFFGNKLHVKFDAVLASYHDQGLIPFKTLTFGEGVNFTSGLSHVRTSPDHGTGFDIAGKGVASTTSFIAAVSMAARIYRQRKQYEKLTENSLKPQTRKR